MGPDRNMPPSIRYVNVGSAAFGRGAALGRMRVHFDLVVTNRSAYRPHDASLNGLNGRFAQINFAANTRVDLRVTVTRSCCVLRNCRACDTAGSAQQIAQCYAAGCCCFGATCTSRPCCARGPRDAKRLAYGCNAMDAPLVLPASAMVGMAIYDFDNGANGEYAEQLVAGGYEYFQTPLRPTSGNAIASTIAVDRATGTFSSMASGTSDNNPSDPLALTDEQAANAVQLFFRPRNGYVDASFAVLYTGSEPAPAGRNLLFAGDSSLCSRPPPAAVAAAKLAAATAVAVATSAASATPISAAVPPAAVATTAAAQPAPATSFAAAAAPSVAFAATTTATIALAAATPRLHEPARSKLSAVGANR